MWHLWLACILPFPPEGHPPHSSTTTDTADTLSDEFDDPGTLSDWTEVWEVEGGLESQLGTLEIADGKLHMVPDACTWSRNWRGPLLFKEVTGDVVVTTEVVVNPLSGKGLPTAQQSNAGLMLRTSLEGIDPFQQYDLNDWVFVAVGRMDKSTGEIEARSTDDADQPAIAEVDSFLQATLRLARLGSAVIALFRGPQEWEVLARFERTDLEGLQVGAFAQSDSLAAFEATIEDHNSGIDIGGAPDLDARFDYVRFATPQLPDELVGLDLTDETQVSDDQLVSFLGDTLP